jgi:hypothetical protein
VDPTPEELRRIAEEVSKAFPSRREGTELVLMEIDPRRAHAYWHVAPSDFESATRSAGDAQQPLVVRMYDISGVQFDGANARSSFDVQVQGLQGHWYIDLFADGRTYTAELGLRRSDGSLIRLARSNTIRTPSSRESAFYENVPVDTGNGKKHEPTVEEVLDRASRRNSDVLAGLEHLDAPGTAGNTEYPLLAGERTSAAEDSEGDEQEPGVVPEDETTPIVEIPLGWPTGEAAAAGAPAQEMSAPADARVEEPEWPSAAAAAVGLPTTSESPSAFREIEESTPAITRADDAARRELVDAAPQGAPPAATVPLANYVTYSSGESGRKEVSLEINTELHIWGRAKPNSELILFGQKVQTRPDGTFSIRRPLPQGAVVIPLLYSGGESSGPSSQP